MSLALTRSLQHAMNIFYLLLYPCDSVTIAGARFFFFYDLCCMRNKLRKNTEKKPLQMINVLLFLSISCISGADSHFDSLAAVITLTLMPNSIVLPVHLFPRCPPANQLANSCHVHQPTFIFHFSRLGAKPSQKGKKKNV